MSALHVGLFLLASGVSGLVRWNIGERLRSASGFGWGTIAVNVSGSFALGLLRGADDVVLTILGVGALGALTTFSSFVKELADEVQAGEWLRATAYGSLSIGGSVAAAAIGLQL